MHSQFLRPDATAGFTVAGTWKEAGHRRFALEFSLHTLQLLIGNVGLFVRSNHCCFSGACSVSTAESPPYQLEANDRYTVVTLEPKLANEQWGDIHEVGSQLVQRVEESKPPHLLVDLSGMEYIGSSTVALIVRLWKAMKKHEGVLAVVNNHPVVLEVLQIAGLSKVWTIVDTRERALSELGLQEKSGGFLPIGIGLFAVVVAVVGLVIQLSPGLSAPPAVTLGLLFGGAGLGVLLGLINGFTQSSLHRTIAVLSLLASLAVGIVGFMQMSG
jgi:anti-anti-sigma factor